MSKIDTHEAEDFPIVGEVKTSAEAAIATSNRDVITKIYESARELVPDELSQGVDGSRQFVTHAGVIRLVYQGERSAVEDSAQGKRVNPAIDKLSELVAAQKVIHKEVKGASRGFKPEGDPLYAALDKAWGPVYAFTDSDTSEVICYSVKVDTYRDAETVLVSPEHIDRDLIDRLNDN